MVDEVFRTRGEQELLRQILFELRKLGNNLNQIAHHLNLSALIAAPTSSQNEIKNTTKLIKILIEDVKNKLI